MTIHSIVGLMNSGKTLFLTLCLYKDFLKGRTIITNYHVNFPHYQINRDYLFYLAQTQPDTRNISFGFDELWIYLDCRSSQENKIATYFFLQSSKGDTQVYITAQDNSQNDLRIRTNQHLLTVCERRILVDKKLKKISDEQRHLPSWINNKLYIIARTYVQKIVIYQRDYVFKKRQIIKAKPIFNLYDTNYKMKAK